MDKEMYSNMSCLTEAPPEVERGIALHKVCLDSLMAQCVDSFIWKEKENKEKEKPNTSALDSLLF